MFFKKGDSVTMLGNCWTGLSGEPGYRNLKGETFTVLEVEPVPYEEILFNWDTGDGGVGHSEVVVIEVDGERKTFSGSWFDPECQDRGKVNAQPVDDI